MPVTFAGGRNRLILTLVLALALLLSAPGIPALTTQNDAGLGVDAGDTFATAATLPGFGTYQGSLAPSDADWYKVTGVSGGTRCYTVSSSSDQAARLGARFETGAASYVANTQNAAGATAVSAVAVTAPGSVYVVRENLGSQPSGYGFTLSEVAVPSTSAEDALTGRDAGGSLATAIPVAPGCIAGRLALLRLGDAADYYSFTAQAGQQVTYSFAADSNAITLSVLNAAGGVVANAVRTGAMVTFTAPSTSTYYFQASSDNRSFDELPYFVALVVGPPDPGNGCRPYC